MVECLAYPKPWVPSPAPCKPAMWHMPLISALRRGRQEDKVGQGHPELRGRVAASLGYMR